MEYNEFEKENNINSKKIDIKSMFISMIAATLSLIVAMILYILIAITNNYHPIFAIIIFVLPFISYMFVVDKLKNHKKKQYELETGKYTKSKFYTPQFGSEMSDIEIIIGIIFTYIISMFGIYIAESLSYTFFALKNLVPESGFFVTFLYIIANAIKIEGVGSYIITGWIAITVTMLIGVVIAIIKKMLGKTIFDDN